MSADFIAGYLSGAVSIIVGNPWDVLKTRLQAGQKGSAPTQNFKSWDTLVRGSLAPILGYGALNALLFTAYNTSLSTLLHLQEPPSITTPTNLPNHPNSSPTQDTSATKTTANRSTAPLSTIFLAGTLGGAATFLVSAPTELLKCRAQVIVPASLTTSTPARGGGGSAATVSKSRMTTPHTTLSITRSIYRTEGLPGFYRGGGVTVVRDALGYGFYFYTYEQTKRLLRRYRNSQSPPSPSSSSNQTLTGSTEEEEEKEDKEQQDDAPTILLCGGLAGLATWASIFPLDVLKTRIQTSSFPPPRPPFIPSSSFPSSPSSPSPSSSTAKATSKSKRPSAYSLAISIVQTEGLGALFRGFGVCSVRAFVVNAAQWWVYEEVVKFIGKC